MSKRCALEQSSTPPLRKLEHCQMYVNSTSDSSHTSSVLHHVSEVGLPFCCSDQWMAIETKQRQQIRLLTIPSLKWTRVAMHLEVWDLVRAAKPLFYSLRHLTSRGVPVGGLGGLAWPFEGRWPGLKMYSNPGKEFESQRNMS